MLMIKKNCMQFIKVSKDEQIAMLIKKTNKLLDEWKSSYQYKKWKKND